MGVTTNGDDVLTLVHPGPRLEHFRQPISAGELMIKYPRHCIARPDVFEFPWIALHPQAILPRGCVFFLVPYYTIHSLLKSRRQQREIYRIPSLQCMSYNRRKIDHQECCNGGGHLQRLLDRLMKRNVSEREREKRSCYRCDSTGDSKGRPRVTSGELAELMRVKPCLRRPESDRKSLNLRVRFYDHTAIGRSRRRSRTE